MDPKDSFFAMMKVALDAFQHRSIDTKDGTRVIYELKMFPDHQRIQIASGLSSLAATQKHFRERYGTEKPMFSPKPRENGITVDAEVWKHINFDAAKITLGHMRDLVLNRWKAKEPIIREGAESKWLVIANNSNPDGPVKERVYFNGPHSGAVVTVIGRWLGYEAAYQGRELPSKIPLGTNEEGKVQLELPYPDIYPILTQAGASIQPDCHMLNIVRQDSRSPQEGTSFGRE